MIQSCATSPEEDKIKIVEEPSGNCTEIATLSSVGFNILPPVATMLAKKGLKMKARDFGVDEIVVNEKNGTFQVEMEATGYQCY